MAMGICSINGADAILKYGNMLMAALHGHIYLKLNVPL